MSAGLDASTVTPGRMAPEASWTVPVRVACANTVAGSSKTTRTSRYFFTVRMRDPVLLLLNTSWHAKPKDFACRIRRIGTARAEVKPVTSRNYGETAVDPEFRMADQHQLHAGC